jgi:hypothetical protein
MATFTISRSANSITINSYTDEQPGQYKLSVDSLNNILVIKAEDGGYQGEVHTLVDTVTVNGEAFTGTAAELKTQLLSDVFTVGDSGSTTPTSGDVDITDLTTIPLASVATKDIVNLTSDNATETVDALSGGTENVVYELRPASNITSLTITGTGAASAAAGDIILPTADLVLNGSKGDYIKIVKRGTKYYQVDAQQFI